MASRTSKSAFLHDQVRMAVLDGRYMPGERIDPAALADEFRTSPTPVRFALYRLVGEGMIADHAREGFHVPLTTEVALRERYDWMQRLLIMACDIGFARASKTDVAFDIERDRDIVLRTGELFEAIALATGHQCLCHAVRHTNDRLAPIRRIKHALFPNAPGELTALTEHWQKRDLKALRVGLIGYHERRKRLVPRIVAALGNPKLRVPR